ncbi:MAG TPA: sulfotransferase family protein, partial [Chromatiaceae bacterium]|nr:sulfotransferase family protein [Chromatiaceae bacterium]
REIASPFSLAVCYAPYSSSGFPAHIVSNPLIEKSKIQQLIQSSQFEQACSLCSQATEQQPADAELWFLLGAIEGQLSRFDRAEVACRRALMLAPQHGGLHYNLAVTLIRQSKPDEAITSFLQAIKLHPEMTEAHCDLGNTYLSLGRLADAENQFDQALRLQPNNPTVNLGRARLKQAQGQPQQAIDAFQAILASAPDFFDASNELAGLLIDGYHFEPAKLVLQSGLEHHPRSADLRYKLGLAFSEQGETDNALIHYQAAHGLAPERDDITAACASTLSLRGDTQASNELLLKLLQANTRDPSALVTLGYLAPKLGRDAEITRLLEAHVDRDGFSDKAKSKLGFALCKLHDRAKNYDLAFARARSANQLHSQTFDPDIFAHSCERNQQFFCNTPHDPTDHGCASEKPVFVVGMPRSGTSLVEQILATHSQITGGGELKDIGLIVNQITKLSDSPDAYPQGLKTLMPDQITALAQNYLGTLDHIATDSRYVIDKTPGNFLQLGLIRHLFPNAHIIHIRRDPLDTCLSCYFHDFGGNHPYAYDLTSLGQYYRQYQLVMAGWRDLLDLKLLEIRYEDIVNDLEGKARELVTFLGLEWEPQLLNYHETQRTVSTASADQVRQPIYRGAIGRARHYEQHPIPMIVTAPAGC